MMTANLSQLTKRLEEINKHSLEELMTPRSILVALDADVQLKRVRRLKNSKVSYFPVYEGDLDNVIGWLAKDQVLGFLDLPPEIVDVRKSLRPVGRISMDTKVSELAEHFLKSRSPFLVVANPEGLTLGIVPLSEFVELLFGFELNAEEPEAPINDALTVFSEPSLLEQY